MSPSPSEGGPRSPPPGASVAEPAGLGGPGVLTAAPRVDSSSRGTALLHTDMPPDNGSNRVTTRLLNGATWCHGHGAERSGSAPGRPKQLSFLPLHVTDADSTRLAIRKGCKLDTGWFTQNHKPHGLEGQARLTGGRGRHVPLTLVSNQSYVPGSRDHSPSLSRGHHVTAPALFPICPLLIPHL